jgi:hypothetical protein
MLKGKTVETNVSLKMLKIKRAYEVSVLFHWPSEQTVTRQGVNTVTPGVIHISDPQRSSAYPEDRSGVKRSTSTGTPLQNRELVRPKNRGYI